MAARLTLFVMRIGVALPVLGVVWKAGKAKYGDLMPGAGFFDGT